MNGEQLLAAYGSAFYWTQAAPYRAEIIRRLDMFAKTIPVAK